MNKGYLTSPFNDKYFNNSYSLLLKAMNNNMLLNQNLVNKANDQAFIGLNNLIKSANLRLDINNMPGISTYFQKTLDVNQFLKSLEFIFQNINISTNTTNLSHLFSDIHLVSSDTLFNQTPLSAWEENEDDSISDFPNNMEEKTSNEIESGEISKISNNLLEQATNYGKKFSHGFFAPIKDPEELGKLVFEIMTTILFPSQWDFLFFSKLVNVDFQSIGYFTYRFK